MSKEQNMQILSENKTTQLLSDEQEYEDTDRSKQKHTEILSEEQKYGDFI